MFCAKNYQKVLMKKRKSSDFSLRSFNYSSSNNDPPTPAVNLPKKKIMRAWIIKFRLSLILLLVLTTRNSFFVVMCVARFSETFLAVFIIENFIISSLPFARTVRLRGFCFENRLFVGRRWPLFDFDAALKGEWLFRIFFQMFFFVFVLKHRRIKRNF